MTKTKKGQAKMPAIRNFVAKNQWQRGGVHDKPNKAKRQKSKQELRRAIRIKSDADFFMGGLSVFRLSV
ncbi:MAG: hypothetical protein KGV56_01660 [Gammaproteobacteria bacterium]|nr:hypothetical protein [Gammaproteobacteria bacterium]